MRDRSREILHGAVDFVAPVRLCGVTIPRRATTVRVQDGNTIELNEGNFLLLSKALFAAIENKYT